MTLIDKRQKDRRATLQHYTEQLEVSRLMAENERLRDDSNRLKAMLPLFEEARDAITVIPLAAAKLHGLNLDLAERMDQVGIAEEWQKHRATLSGEPQ